MDVSDRDPLEQASSLTALEQKFFWALARRAFQSVIWETTTVDFTPEQERKVEDRRRVAALMVDLPDPRHHSTAAPRGKKLGYDGYQYRQVKFKTKHGNQVSGNLIMECLKDFLSHCRQEGQSPHFAVLNELAASFDGRGSLLRKARDTAKRFGTYLVVGSYHSPQNFFSVSPVFSPHGDEGEVLKQNSAVRQGEFVRTPDKRNITVYCTEYGDFVLWVCLDIYDPGLMLKFINMSYRFARNPRLPSVHLVLVPSYNKDEKENIASALSLLSRFGKVAVVCANSFPGRLEAFGYLGGEDLPVVLDVQRTIQGKLSYRGVVYEYSHQELEKLKMRSPAEDQTYSTQFAALIGGSPYSLTTF